MYSLSPYVFAMFIENGDKDFEVTKKELKEGKCLVMLCMIYWSIMKEI